MDGGLGGVEGDLLYGGGGCGEVGGLLGGRVIAPGAYRVEVGNEVGREAGGEEFAIELGGEVGGEVLGHDDADEDGVAGMPGFGDVAEDVELDGEGFLVGGDVGVDAVGVGLEFVELVGGKDGGGAVGGGAELEDALLAVVLDEGGAEDFGERSGAVTTKGVHLEEAVGGGDVALGEEEIVEVGGVDGGDVLRVAGDGDGRGEAGDGNGAVEEALAGEEVGVHVAAERVGDDRERDEEEGEQDAEGEGDTGEEAAVQFKCRTVLHRRRAWGLGIDWSGAVAEGCGVVRIFGVGGIHGLERF